MYKYKLDKSKCHQEVISVTKKTKMNKEIKGRENRPVTVLRGSRGQPSSQDSSQPS